MQKKNAKGKGEEEPNGKKSAEGSHTWTRKGDELRAQVQTQLWMEHFPSMGRDSLLCSGHLKRTNATNHKTIWKPSPPSPAPSNLPSSGQQMGFHYVGYL